eukprot:TRINITY_DN1965_c0_g2_i1.p1 TRINITY_DN1965_c0_g2~~TRINITY_DN1965_c0_g2_i1.p1  ORF type:complete len:144 (-),score=22.22 TRINITY_DN1965_c0_g2_i1:190-621(-)
MFGHGLVLFTLFLSIQAQTTYQCFLNDHFTDVHYYAINSTDASGNIIYVGFDVVDPSQPNVVMVLTGSYNKVSKLYSFNTNQPPDLYINQWGEDEQGKWLPGLFYSFKLDPNIKQPIDDALLPSTFSRCPPRVVDPSTLLYVH